MKKIVLISQVIVLVLGAVQAQGQTQAPVQGTVYTQSAGGPVEQLDNAVKALAGDLSKKLSAGKAQKIAVGQFIYRDSVPPLCQYWVNQLTQELVNIPNRSFTILSGGSSGSDWTISGELVEAANTIRVYTRLIRSSDRAVEAAFNSDIERNDSTIQMLSGDSRSGSSSSSVSRDEREPDSMGNPVVYEIGGDESVPVMSRTIHDDNDQDFFLLIPANNGRLVMETTGNMDTHMEFYNADTQEKLSSDDDSGSGDNARIRYNVQAGKRYIAKVWGYSDENGPYGFRAYLQAQASVAPDEYEPDDSSSQAKLIEIGVPRQHTFHTSDDVDWVKFQVTQGGRYTIRAKGVRTNRLDTYIELFNANLNSIDEDDDGGENLDSRLSLRLDAGLYYLKVYCLDDEPDQPYTISIEAE